MAEKPISIWKVPAYLPYLQPTLNSIMIEQAQKHLGVALPAAYLDLLRLQNGGYLRQCLPEIYHEVINGIGPHYPNLVSQYDGFCDVLEEISAHAKPGEWLVADFRSLIPFDGDGHWFLCLDYRSHGKSGEPQVTFVDIENEQEQVVATSFAAFLSALKPELIANGVAILDGLSLEAVVTRLDAAFGKTFDNLDTQSYGYPVYRWALGNGQTREWVWLSPNLVARGFVRQTDPRYRELVDTLAGTAMRLPDDPDVQFILTHTDGLAEIVRTAWSRAALLTRLLA